MILSNKLKEFVFSDVKRLEVLQIVHSLGLKDSWVGAGFVRNLVWDCLHNYKKATVLNDIDVIFFDRSLPESHNCVYQKQLEEMLPRYHWSVKNQAYMHLWHGHAPYNSCQEAISYWVETATCVAVSLSTDFKILSPYGLEDLFELRLKAVSSTNYSLMQKRIGNKKWTEIWPKLTICQ